MADLSKYAVCRKCGSYYPPDAGHSEVICKKIERWKYPARAQTQEEG